ncbi:MAG: PKD domain-containing protein, partial [Bacteroidota bacterium]
GIKGHAFLDQNGQYTYVLWAATSVDNSETVSATYDFPSALNIDQLEKRSWDFSQSQVVENSSSQGIALSARPIFLTDLNHTVLISPSADFSVNQVAGCIPLDVTFTDESTTNVTEWQWEFPGGTPSSSTLQHPSVSYATPGTYAVKLTVSNAAGESVLVKADYLVVSEALPQADFSVNILGQVATFVNLSENATSYSWDLADGNKSTLANPTNDYTTNSYYDVVLIAHNGCGADTAIQSIIIGPETLVPHAEFNATTTSGCAPLTVQFHDQSTENTTGWWWQFQGGDPASSTEQNPVVTFDEPGSYFVRLIAANAAGSDEKFKGEFIQITGAPPTADFTFGTSGLNLFAFNGSNDAQTYLWNFGDGQSSTETNPSHTYATNGSYRLELIAFNGCGTDTLAQWIDLSNLPTANFSVTSPQACPGTPIQFTSLAASTTTNWQWSFPGGNPASSTAVNPVVTYDQPGTYSVTLEVSNAFGSDVLNQENFILIVDDPTAQFTVQVDGATLQLGNQSVAATAYSWDFGDGQNSTDIAPAHLYTANGNYTVELLASNACGADTIRQVINIDNSPVANFTATPTQHCVSASVQFSSLASDNTTVWNWSFPGGNPSSSSLPNPVVTYPQAGNYSFVLEVSNSFGSDSFEQSQFIDVQALPIASFSTTIDGPNVQLNNQSANATSYSWNFGDGQSSSDPAPSHLFTANGNYTIQLIASNSCGVDTMSQVINIDNSPTANFTADATEICAPASIQFSSLASENTTTWH